MDSEINFGYRPDAGFGDLLNIIREDPEYGNLNEAKEKDKQDKIDKVPGTMEVQEKPSEDINTLDLEDYDKEDFNTPGKEVPSKSKKDPKRKLIEIPKTLGNQVLKDSVQNLYLCNNCFKTFRNIEASCPECHSNIVEMIAEAVDMLPAYTVVWKNASEAEAPERYVDVHANTPEQAEFKVKNVLKRSGVDVNAVKILSTEVKEAKGYDHIEGGLGDKKVVSDFDPQQVKWGIKIEMEHTNDPVIAKEIAIDHLTEDPEYYTKLKRMEAGSCDKSKKESKLKEEDDFIYYCTRCGKRFEEPVGVTGGCPYCGASDAFVENLEETQRAFKKESKVVECKPEHEMENAAGLNDESDAIALYKKYRSQGKSREESIHKAVVALKREFNHEELRNLILKHGVREAIKNSKLQEADAAALHAKKQEIEQKMLDAEKAYQEEQNRMGSEVDEINQLLRDAEEKE